jgi:hypothetical protein
MQVDNADDMRLQTRLFNTCLPDKKTVRYVPPLPLHSCRLGRDHARSLRLACTT